jgi:uncharacterized protein (DUF2235 family)
LLRDTVKSVGIYPQADLPFASNNKSIQYFRHALSLDEHRVKFIPSYYYSTCDDETDKVKSDDIWSKITCYANLSSTGPVYRGLRPVCQGLRNLCGNILNTNKDKEKDPEADTSPTQLKPNAFSTQLDKSATGVKEPKRSTDVKEVWFAGAHCGTYLLF